MNNRLFFVINPIAGNGRARQLWAEVSERLTADSIAFDFVLTTCKGDAIQIAQHAASKNYKCYISVGGDGTFHEMINGLMRANIQELPTVFLIPAGTSNDFVREHGIPKWGAEWHQMLQEFKVKKHNVGKLNYQLGKKKKDRYFVNVAGLFYDGFIVRATSLRKKPIRVPFLYLLFILKFLFKYKPPKGEITWENGELSGAFYTANIGISRYSGAGMRFVPHANPFGKKLAVTVARKMHPIRVLFSTPYFYNGKVEQHRKVTCFESSHLTILPTTDEDILVEADGEFLGKAPCQFDLMVGAFLLVC